MSRRRCCGCKIFEDEFNRDDSTDLGLSWTEVAGDWGILDNELHVGSADAKVLLVYEPPGNPQEYIIYVTMRADDTGDQLWVTVGDEAYKIQVEWGEDATGYEGRLRIYDSTPTLRGSRGFANLKPGAEVAVVIYVGDGYITVTAGGTVLSIEAVLTEGQIHLGTDDLSNNAYFDDFEIQKHYNEDNVCPRINPVCTYFDYPVNLPNGNYIDDDDWDTSGAVGTWDINSNQIAVSNNGSKLMSLCENPADVIQTLITVVMTANEENDVLKVFFNGTDYVEFKWITGLVTAEARVYVGGILQPPVGYFEADAGTTITVKLCITRYHINVVVDVANLNITRVVECNSQIFGIGTGTISGEVYFNVTASRTNFTLAGCPPCQVECSNCEDDNATSYLTATLNDIIAAACGNTDCEDLNGPWLVEYGVSDFHVACTVIPDSPLECKWGYGEERSGWCGDSGEGITYGVELIITAAFSIMPFGWYWLGKLTIWKCVNGNPHSSCDYYWNSVVEEDLVDCLVVSKTLAFDHVTCYSGMVSPCDMSGSTITLETAL